MSFAPALPDGVRIYAIGDVHGRDDLLAILLEKIEQEIERCRNDKTLIVFLGDLIDRGPDSAKVLDRLSGLGDRGYRIVCLMGNHEEALIRILEGESAFLTDWLRFGGEAFARSYGLAKDDLKDRPATAAARMLRDAVPARHYQFLKGFYDSFRAGDYFFCHAGIRPGEPLEHQHPRDLRWIRAPFLNHSGPHEAMIVHGHTISETIDFQPYRIGVDTGAYKTGLLSALGLRGTEQWTLHATITNELVESGAGRW